MAYDPMNVAIFATLVAKWTEEVGAVTDDRLLYDKLFTKGLREYRAGYGWSLTRAGQNLLDSAGCLIENAGKRDSTD